MYRSLWWRSMFACVSQSSSLALEPYSAPLSLTHHISFISKPLFRSSKEIQNLTHFIISLLGPSPNHVCLDYYSSPKLLLCSLACSRQSNRSQSDLLKPHSKSNYARPLLSTCRVPTVCRIDSKLLLKTTRTLCDITLDPQLQAH